MEQIEKRIKEHEAEAAKANGKDRARYWKARRDLLLAQAELAKESQRYGDLPY